MFVVNYVVMSTSTNKNKSSHVFCVRFSLAVTCFVFDSLKVTHMAVSTILFYGTVLLDYYKSSIRDCGLKGGFEQTPQTKSSSSVIYQSF